MRSRFSVRVAMLVLTVVLSTAPAFAVGRRDDTPIGPGERVVRIIKQIIKHLVPSTLGDEVSVPKP